MTGLRFEFTRVVSLRIVRWMCFVAVLINTLVTTAIGIFLSHGPIPQSSYSSQEAFRLLLSSSPALPLGAALIGAVLGGMEFRHSLLETTMLVCQRRSRLILVKSIVVGGLSAVLAVVCELVSILVVALSGLSLSGISIGMLIGQLARVVVWGIVGLLLSVAFRSQTFSVVGILIMALLVEPAIRGVASIGRGGLWTHVSSYLPFSAFDQLVPQAPGGGLVFDNVGSLSAGISIVVTICYLTLLLAGSWTSLGGVVRGRGVID